MAGNLIVLRTWLRAPLITDPTLRTLLGWTFQDERVNWMRVKRSITFPRVLLSDITQEDPSVPLYDNNVRVDVFHMNPDKTEVIANQILNLWKLGAMGPCIGWKPSYLKHQTDVDDDVGEGDIEHRGMVFRLLAYATTL